MAQHYAIDAAVLLDQCLEGLQEVIAADEECRGSHSVLYDLKKELVVTEGLLYRYFQKLLEEECNKSSHSFEKIRLHFSQRKHSSLSNSVECLRLLREEIVSDRKKSSEENPVAPSSHHTLEHNDDANGYYPPRRTASDTLLFRLIVALQLSLVRIDDARYVVTGRRRRQSDSDQQAATTYYNSSRTVQLTLTVSGYVGFAVLSTFCLSRNTGLQSTHQRDHNYRMPALKSAGLGLMTLTAAWLHSRWKGMWMTKKLNNTVYELENWNRQWQGVQSTTQKKKTSPSSAQDDTAKSQRLIQYALQDTSKSSFWHSQGELRFLMLKRFMDVFYASVGTAVEVTNCHSDQDAANWQTTLATAAFSSFYSLTGASRKASEVSSSSQSAMTLIQNAWGMVSLPAMKSISLQISRLLKGAAVADRIEIAGVSCFVLSREPAPELAAGCLRFHRKRDERQRSRSSSGLHSLSTIDEQCEHTPDPPLLLRKKSKPFARSSTTRYRQRDVLFHLTGGGFFAHIIASDLPYLMDWSASTGAVVICPEYDLLPQHTFPVALNQVENVYRALVSGHAISLLGFEVNRIIVTGESVGGNLAAALCIKLCMAADERAKSHSTVQKDGEMSTAEAEDVQTAPLEVESEREERGGCDDEETACIGLPDALMLSCPVLDLSLDELSYSRVVGQQDPVLPSGLISCISDAYLSQELGMSKKDPLVSPFYATDNVLSRFPPTLLFASSSDPLLDDSVVFNQRLRSLGVESDLRAAQNMPHAYLGLGTAGFPEAQQVQQECQEWLAYQFTHDSQRKS